PVDPGDLHAEAAPELGEAPEMCRQPGEAGFGEHYLQVREFAEDALADQARHLRLKGLRVGGIVFGVVRGPADAGYGVAVAAASVDAERQSVAFRRRPDWPVDALAERHLAHDRDQHLNEALIGRQ